MKNVIEKEIDGEKIFLKKGRLGYTIVHPTRTLDGKINWINFLVGGKQNLVRLIVYALIVLLLYIGINEILAGCKILAADPCSFCANMSGKFLGGDIYGGKSPLSMYP